MITKRQQDVAYRELSKLFDPESLIKLTIVQACALRVALAMLINDPVQAGEYSKMLDVLIETKRRLENGR